MEIFKVLFGVLHNLGGVSFKIFFQFSEYVLVTLLGYDLVIPSYHFSLLAVLCPEIVVVSLKFLQITMNFMIQRYDLFSSRQYFDQLLEISELYDVCFLLVDSLLLDKALVVLSDSIPHLVYPLFVFIQRHEYFAIFTVACFSARFFIKTSLGLCFDQKELLCGFFITHHVLSKLPKLVHFLVNLIKGKLGRLDFKV